MNNLARFHDAQAIPDSGFERALAEIRSGAKRGHWIWYVFPQLRGLGRSAMSREYAIADAAEAADYLRDPELRTRLLAITTAVAEQLRRPDAPSLVTLMGSDIDAQKLASSLTLFGHVARALVADEPGDADGYREQAELSDEVQAVATSQGYPPCKFTLEHARAQTLHKEPPPGPNC